MPTAEHFFCSKSSFNLSGGFVDTFILYDLGGGRIHFAKTQSERNIDEEIHFNH